MADEELELDYEEDKDEVKEELLEPNKKATAASSVCERTESLNESKAAHNDEGKETQSRRDIFTSGRLSGLKARRWPDDSCEKHNDESDKGEESSDDSDTETGEFFRETDRKTDSSFPTFPISRDEVKVDLGLTNRHLRSAVIVYGIKDMEPYKVLQIFTEFGADRWNEIDENSCLVQFQSKKFALKMMVEMSRTLTTNFRHFVEHKKSEGKVDDDAMETNREEGEVDSDDDDDEGEVTESRAKNSCYKIGDDVRSTDHVTYINSKKHCIPEQKWRVVERHVPGRQVLLVSFATNKQKTLAEENANLIVVTGKNVDSDGLEYSWQGDKVRAGLNIYDNDGNELEWDYGHDTRFYKEGDAKKPEEEAVKEKEWEKPALQVGIKGAVKVRGRGAKRFLGEDSETLNSDEAVGQAKKLRKRSDSDDWRSARPSDKPTRCLD